jgi:hypothetical protein
VKFAIVSDSHNNVKNFKKIIIWLNQENIRLILHCGDIGSPEFLEESLQDFDGKFFGVLGNMDRDYKTLVSDYNKIKNVKIMERILEIPIDKKMIAITHYPETAKSLAESGKYKLVFYGHTHKPWEEKIIAGAKDCRLINPGETAGQIFKPCFAIYDTEKDFLELKILEKL